MHKLKSHICICHRTQLTSTNFQQMFGLHTWIYFIFRLANSLQTQIDSSRSKRDMLISYIRERLGETNFSACPDVRTVFSTPRFSINHGEIGFPRICEMENAFERLNKSGINLTSQSRELRIYKDESTRSRRKDKRHLLFDRAKKNL